MSTEGRSTSKAGASRRRTGLLLLLLLGLALGFRGELRFAFGYLRQRLFERATVASRLAEFGAAVDERLRLRFEAAGVDYPPEELALIAIKDSKILQVQARGPAQEFRRVLEYPILAMSGGLGPKLRSGDKQVPEGLYAIESLNPNSLFHVPLRIGYPSEEDLEMARQDGRAELGGDIMIHGSNVSIGCLAMGDPAAEDLFVLVARTGLDHAVAILAPVDFRVRPDFRPPAGAPAWTEARYRQIREALASHSSKNP